MLQNYTLFNESLNAINQQKTLINTLNAHSFNTLHLDEDFDNALHHSNVLLPDGIGVVWAMRLLTGQKLHKIAGADLFFYEMDRINKFGGKCFFLGSSDETLLKIKNRAEKDYPNVQVFSYSPPYKSEFTEEDSKSMIDRINAVEPDVLFVGLTAPKQEKWTYHNFGQLLVGHVCCIGAVFDFYAGNIKRAPHWLILIGMEWSYRLIKEPRRMWRRYLIGNAKFIGYILMEKVGMLI
ncbi:MAG: WecB/TagA/CpsF family glycosyltransferase [Paludibacter sp.]|nr:WecB/TagA/CpsF family glycosyltransferase [Paludibacter sp.]